MARILLADDDSSIRQLMKAVLEPGGHDVVTVASGGEATKRLDAEGFDLLIADHLMPGITGLGLVAYARRKAPQMKILLISALAASEMALRAREQGADGFIGKPFHSIEELREQVREVLR